MTKTPVTHWLLTGTILAENGEIFFMAREGLTEEDKQQLQQEVIKLGLRTVRLAKQKAPVDTGRLRASITLADSEGLIQPIGAEAGSNDSVSIPTGKFVVRVGTNVDYAIDVEFGTVNQPAQPFLRPAADQALKERSIDT